MVAFAGFCAPKATGRMVVLSSVAGVRVRRANFIYGSSKAGLDAFTIGLGDSLRQTGASVDGGERPGWVATRMTAAWRRVRWPHGRRSSAADVVTAMGKEPTSCGSPGAAQVDLRRPAPPARPCAAADARLICAGCPGRQQGAAATMLSRT